MQSNALRYWEDYELGRKYPLGSTSFTEQEIVDFARLYDPQRFHVDVEAARGSMFGGLIASGWHVASKLMRLFVDNYIDTRTALGSDVARDNPYFAEIESPFASGEKLHAVKAIVPDVAIVHVQRADAQGNAHKQLGTYTTTQGQTRAATDVWVQTDATLSMPTAWVEVPEAIASLPDAQGYGKVRDLHQAMAQDASGQLTALVSAFTQADTLEDRMALVRQIVVQNDGIAKMLFSSCGRFLFLGTATGKLQLVAL